MYGIFLFPPTLALRCTSCYYVFNQISEVLTLDQEMMKGSIDLLILTLIEKEDMYGYEISRKIKQLSEDTYEMSEGTLYAALKRMERKSWIQSYWLDTESGRRKYYQMTKDGTRELARKKDNWRWMDQLIRKSAE